MIDQLTQRLSAATLAVLLGAGCATPLTGRPPSAGERAAQAEEIRASLAKKSDTFVARTLSPSLAALVDAMQAHAGTRQADGAYLMDVPGPGAEGVFNYGKFALRTDDPKAGAIRIDVGRVANNEARGPYLTVGSTSYWFTPLGFMGLINDAANRAEVQQDWHNRDVFWEIQRQVWWLGQQTGVFNQHEFAVSVLQSLASRDGGRVTSRVMAVADAMAASGRTFELVPPTGLAAFDALDAGAHRQALSWFSTRHTPAAGSVRFTVGAAPTIYSGPPEDLAFFLMGFLTGDNANVQLCAAIVDGLARQLAAR